MHADFLQKSDRLMFMFGEADNCYVAYDAV